VFTLLKTQISTFKYLKYFVNFKFNVTYHAKCFSEQQCQFNTVCFAAPLYSYKVYQYYVTQLSVIYCGCSIFSSVLVC